MQLSQPNATVFIPDQSHVPAALERITHLGVGAHQDDLEFMAYHGILECFYKAQPSFGGVTCTNGAGSSRTGAYASCTDESMQAIRREEQNKAAVIGRFAAMIQLDHPSSLVKNSSDNRLREDLAKVLQACTPQIIYTHNPADKHDTHLGVTVALIEAVRSLPTERRPSAVHGCEVWRNLDWMNDSEKVIHDVSGNENLAAALGGVFDSQIAGGKRYDLAVMGRRRANATFFDSHNSDKATAIAFAMDLTPLVKDASLDILDFTLSHIERFAADVRERLGKRLGKF